jgi:hypothetical protein
MLLRLFKGNSPALIFLVAIIFAAVWISAFIRPSAAALPVAAHDPMPLYGLLVSLTGNSGFAGAFFPALMAALTAFLLVNFNTSSFFISERTYLPALLYILAGGLFPEFQSMNPALPASILLVLGMIRIADSYRKQGLANNFFDAGLLISTGSLFYANLIWFGIMVFIGIIIIRNINLSEFLIAILGILTPYFLVTGIFYVMGKDPDTVLNLLRDNLFIRTAHYHFTRLAIVSLIIASVIVLAGLAHLYSLLNIKKIKARKTFSLLIWLFFISVAVYYASPSVSVEMVWISAIPCSYFMTHYFIFMKRKLVPEIFLYLIFIMVILIQSVYIF